MLLGRKLKMMRLPLGERMVAVTAIEVGPCYITQIKTKEKDGYCAIQIGYVETKEKRLTKPQLGHLKKNNLPPLKYLKEFRVENPSEFKVGQKLDVSFFKEGEFVDISGITKGKGFAGVVKAHGFSGGPASHGTSLFHRRPGSIGRSKSPGRVVPGTKLPKRLGGDRRTIKNLKIIKIYPQENIMLVAGSVVGKSGGIIEIKKSKSFKNA